ncbi:MAG: hypothetical protein KJO15_13405 [Alphaproteobacteria bacterium]|nr:hypothetical protein [Alphaproteobacteria bacterium]
MQESLGSVFQGQNKDRASADLARKPRVFKGHGKTCKPVETPHFKANCGQRPKGYGRLLFDTKPPKKPRLACFTGLGICGQTHSHNVALSFELGNGHPGGIDKKPLRLQRKKGIGRDCSSNERCGDRHGEPTQLGLAKTPALGRQVIDPSLDLTQKPFWRRGRVNSREKRVKRVLGLVRLAANPAFPDPKTPSHALGSFCINLGSLRRTRRVSGQVSEVP